LHFLSQPIEPLVSLGSAVFADPTAVAAKAPANISIAYRWVPDAETDDRLDLVISHAVLTLGCARAVTGLTRLL
jgi:hypothetical protein